MLSAENVLVKRMARWIVFQPATMMAPFRQNLSVRPAFSIRRMSRQTSCALAHHLCLMAGKVETRLTFGGLVS